MYNSEQPNQYESTDLGEFTRQEWQDFAIKLAALPPKERITARYEYIEKRTGINRSTLQNWVKGDSMPDLKNLWAVKRFLRTDIFTLLHLITSKAELPPLCVGVSSATILAIAQLTPAEIEMIAPKLAGLTREKCYSAIGNLAKLGEILS